MVPGSDALGSHADHRRGGRGLRSECSAASPNPPELLTDNFLQARRFVELLEEVLSQAFDLVFDVFAVIFDVGGADVTPGCECVVSSLDLRQSGGLAEARH